MLNNSGSTISAAGRNIMSNDSIANILASPPKVPCNNLANRSSVHHNILSGEINTHSYRIRLSPKVVTNKMANKTKGITELYNLQAHSAIKKNRDHEAAIL